MDYMPLLYFSGFEGMLLDFWVIPQVGRGFLYVLLKKIFLLFKIGATYMLLRIEIRLMVISVSLFIFDTNCFVCVRAIHAVFRIVQHGSLFQSCSEIHC